MTRQIHIFTLALCVMVPGAWAQDEPGPPMPSSESEEEFSILEGWPQEKVSDSEVESEANSWVEGQVLEIDRETLEVTVFGQEIQGDTAIGLEMNPARATSPSAEHRFSFGDGEESPMVLNSVEESSYVVTDLENLRRGDFVRIGYDSAVSVSSAQVLILDPQIGAF